MKPRAVYIVTSGAYSDYGIEAVFSERADAAAYCKAGGKRRIEVFLMDNTEEEMDRHFWKCVIDIDNGNLLEESEGEEDASPHLRGYSDSDYGFERAAMGTSFVSRDHARKLAAERRQKILREELFDDEAEYEIGEGGKDKE